MFLVTFNLGLCYNGRSMRWSTTLTWLVLPYLYPTNYISLANAQGSVPSPGSKAQPRRAGQPPEQEGARPPREVKDIATELLLLRPLRDGKVATHFEFEYLTRNSIPRDPNTLGVEDEGTFYNFIHFRLLLITVYNDNSSYKRSTLRILPVIYGTNSP